MPRRGPGVPHVSKRRGPVAGSRLIVIQAARGFTNLELAVAAGVSIKCVMNLRHGPVAGVTLGKLVSVARVLSCSPLDILPGLAAVYSMTAPPRRRGGAPLIAVAAARLDAEAAAREAPPARREAPPTLGTAPDPAADPAPLPARTSAGIPAAGHLRRAHPA